MQNFKDKPQKKKTVKTQRKNKLHLIPFEKMFKKEGANCAK